MKFKLTADPKDWLMFAVFAFLWLIVVALIVINLHQFANEGTLHGLNPLPAFGPDFIFATLFFWIGSILALVVSASSTFFDKESGFGLSFTKKESDGYSRWATDKEMKNADGIYKVDPKSEKIEHAGIPIVNDGRNLWVDDSELHTLILGSTGSGKSQMIVLPTISLLARKGESMIVTDPKGEIYEKNGQLLKELGYKIIILNFREPSRGNSWNPLAVPYDLYTNGNKDKALELLEDLGINIVHEDKADDPFWQNTGGDFFNGLAIALFEDAKREEININSIYRMSVAADEKLGTKNLLNTYFSFKDPNDPAFVNATSTINAPSETKGSILSVFRTKIKTFASRENVSEMLSESDFDMRDIGRQKTAVFLRLQDEKKTYHALGTIFIKQCYETLIDEAAKFPNGKLPYRTNFILDEFANMPAFKDIGTMVSAARSRNIRMMFIIQSFGQLEGVYGKDTANNIKGNCNNIVYLISTELEALEEISKLCGEKKSKKDDKTSSTPLVSVSDLQRLPRWSVIILHDRNYPYKTKFTPYFQMNDKGLFGKHYPDLDYPEPKKKTIKIFDIKAYTEKLQKEYVAKKEAEDRRKLQEAMAELERNEMAALEAEKVQREKEAAVKAAEEAEKKAAKEREAAEKKAREEAERVEREKEAAIKAAEEAEKKAAMEREAAEKKAREEAERVEREKEAAIKAAEEEKKKAAKEKEAAEKKARAAKMMPRTDIINDKEEKSSVNVSGLPIKKKDSAVKEEITDDEFFDDFFADED